MITNIRYGGLSAAPSDYDSASGELAFALGTVHENGALTPVLPPTIDSRIELNPADHLSYIHERPSGEKIYIILNQASIPASARYWSESAAGPFPQIDAATHQVTSIGNTLIFLTSSGMRYYLWQDGSYKHLGGHLPELPLSFGLQGEVEWDDELAGSLDGAFPADCQFTDEQYKAASDLITARANKLIAEKSVQAGKFLFPFFVRYALRLYDGTLAMHSAPIYMNAAERVSPQLLDLGVGTSNLRRTTIAGVFHELDYAVINPGTVNNLRSNWSDIIQSVDIFVSLPLYRYDQSKTELLRFNDLGYPYTNDPISLCRHKGGPSAEYRSRTLTELYNQKNPTAGATLYRLCLPKKDEEVFEEEVRSCGQFYFLKSIPLSELPTNNLERRVIKIREGYLETLATQELMTDDYNSHDTLIPKSAFPYNGRLNLSDISKRLFRGFTPQEALQYANSELHDTRAYVYIKQDGRELIVESEISKLEFGSNTPKYFFYPNPNACKLVLDNGHASYAYKLKAHDYLNGAYYYQGGGELLGAQAPEAASSDEQRTIQQPSKLYTSEINNPFLFPATGINTIGAGRIIGISSAAKALSEGQFGQFPLYAFTTEGVWALEVSGSGGFSAKQPITRDVCIDRKSIIQMDSAVLFATDRGLMHLSGAQSVCITDAIADTEFFDVDTLPKIDELVSKFNSNASRLNSPAIQSISTIPFRDFIAGSAIVYDYIHQRIIAYKPDVQYAYVFSLKSKSWGMIQSNIVSSVQSYPEALVVIRDRSGNLRLADFCADSDEQIPALAITRPFSPGTPDIHKTIDTIIQRGAIHKDHIGQVLYGSNDLLNWFVIWSSRDIYLRGFRGTPYKYFRLALVGTFGKHEKLSGFSVQYEERRNNKLR